MIAALLERPLRTLAFGVLAAGVTTSVGTWLHLWWTEGDA